MIEPNRLSVPGEPAARERVEAVFACVDRLSPDDLHLVAVPRRDPEEREILLAELEGIADRNGRGALLDEARDRVRDALVTRAVDPLVPRSAFATPRLASRPEDMVEVVAAIEDAVAVAVVEDRLAPATALALSEPGRRLLGLPSLPGDPDATQPAEDPAWAPSARDWAAAASGETAIEPDEPLPGVRGMRAVFFGVIGVVAAIAAVAWGLAQDQVLLGALGAVAAIAVGWTLATFRSVR